MNEMPTFGVSTDDNENRPKAMKSKKTGKPLPTNSIK